MRRLIGIHWWGKTTKNFSHCRFVTAHQRLIFTWCITCMFHSEKHIFVHAITEPLSQKLVSQCRIKTRLYRKNNAACLKQLSICFTTFTLKAFWGSCCIAIAAPDICSCIKRVWSAALFSPRIKEYMLRKPNTFRKYHEADETLKVISATWLKEPCFLFNYPTHFVSCISSSICISCSNIWYKWPSEIV